MPGTVMPVKVITVPKTLSTPRIIAVESTAMQYAQQGLSDSFTRHIDRSSIGEIMSWKSQEPNQLLALRGSYPMPEIVNRRSLHVGFATLDLSDASDLVDSQLVRDIFRDYPLVLEAVMAMRSPQASVLGKVLDLSKYASMGSALCFPIESIIFTILVFIGLRRVYPTIRPENLIKEFSGLVRVYGDDIVVPVRAAQSVVQTLQAYGLRVNNTKSFWTGMYRESCGKEYFAGLDVTIAKVKHVLPSTRKPITGQEQEIVSTVALRNNLYKRGYHDTAKWLDTILEKCLHGNYPIVLDSSPILGRVNSVDLYQVDRIHPDLQVPLVKGYRVSSHSPSSKLDGYGALVKTLGNRSDDPIFDPQHLLRAGRPRALRIKLGYGKPFGYHIKRDIA
uniref:RNA-directed RNA polymerase n=1 Tax=Leviviridae sp. TaxID=2027243 RepID=A0A514D5Y5_9VIRU|nr:MAG: RNA-dependent RNA polymerase [Leviviridae sp.]